MIITEHIRTVLLVSGAFTLAPIVQLLLPKVGPRLLFGVDPPEGAGGLFTRHWSLLAPCFGALLIYAAWHPEIRTPLMAFAAIEKAGLVGFIIADRKKPHAARMLPIAIFDSLIVTAYAAYLFQLL
jgi:hypothetical protein